MFFLISSAPDLKKYHEILKMATKVCALLLYTEILNSRNFTLVCFRVDLDLYWEHRTQVSTLNRMPVHLRAPFKHIHTLIHTWGQFNHQFTYQHVCGRKPGSPVETHCDHREKILNFSLSCNVSSGLNQGP